MKRNRYVSLVVVVIVLAVLLAKERDEEKQV